MNLSSLKKALLLACFKNIKLLETQTETAVEVQCVIMYKVKLFPVQA
jgi:hypothetical protein